MVAGGRAGVLFLVAPSIGDTVSRRVRVVEGERLVLDCSATGHPQPNITWQRPHRPHSTTNEHPIATQSSLIVERATVGDSGRYVCEAKNEVGKTSADFSVEVLSKPKVTPSYQATVKVIEGEMAKLECHVDANPAANISWMRNGRPIADMSQMILSSRAETLMLLKARRADVGTYSCNNIILDWWPFIGISIG